MTNTKLQTVDTGINESFEYDLRFEKVLKVLDGLDTLIVKNENIFYLTGFQGSAGRLLIKDNKKYLFVDSRYFEFATKVAHKTTVINVIGGASYNDALLIFLKSENIKELVIARDSLYISDFYEIEKTLKPNNITLTLSHFSLDEVRNVKDKKEIEILKDNLVRTEIALTKTLSIVKEGMTEKELAAELEYRLKYEGGDKTSFDTILLFGERSSLPHGKPTDRKLKHGDIILMDFGLSRLGYKSDITRTVFFGKGESFEKMSKIYNIVKEAQDNAINNIKAGITGDKADEFARSVINKNGYEDYFQHGLGHGIGIEIHENPRFSPSYDKVIERGTMVTVEPGIYLPDIGGVRIENIVIVTEKNAVSINTTPTDLIVL